MERHDIYTSLNQILGKIIGDTKLDLNELTTTDEISGWSSLVQTQLVVEIEKHFNCISRKTKCSAFTKHFVPESHLLTQIKM